MEVRTRRCSGSLPSPERHRRRQYGEQQRRLSKRCRSRALDANAAGVAETQSDALAIVAAHEARPLLTTRVSSVPVVNERCLPRRRIEIAGDGDAACASG